MTLRTYKTNKYGSGALYGESDTESLAWGVEVDWDQDGLFDGTNEAEYMTNIHIERGKRSFIKPRGQGFEAVRTGQARIELSNIDGRYDGFNEDSPLYPNVIAGPDVKIRVRDIENGVIYPVFYGFITDIKTKGYGKSAKVTLYIRDALEYLRNYSARVAVTTGDTPAEVIAYVLDYVNFPTRWGQDLTSDTDTINYFWASGNKNAQSVIDDMVESFLGYFYMSNEGKATYIPRTDITDSGIELNEDYLLKDIGLPQPFENNKNVTRIKAHPRTVASTGVIWQLLGDVPAVQTGAGNAEIIWANYTYNDIPVPAESVITPLATTDFLVNSQSDGGGTNLTASCTVGITDFGDTAKLTVTNNSASVGYITKLQIRGDAIYEQNAADVTYPKDESTVTQPRELTLDLLWQQDLNVARDFADLIGSFMETNYPFPTVKIEQRPDLQYSLDLFDIVTLTMPTLGIIGESYRVAGITHDSRTDNCQSIITTYYLEPYISFENFWTFSIQNFGVDTKFGA
ncbi:MAG: hypothetical protein HN975_12715 [Anaerolineae bacterium]|nr:hypothetical protein [Anaerolineae bacterium]